MCLCVLAEPVYVEPMSTTSLRRPWSVLRLRVPPSSSCVDHGQYYVSTMVSTACRRWSVLRVDHGQYYVSTMVSITCRPWSVLRLPVSPSSSCVDHCHWSVLRVDHGQYYVSTMVSTACRPWSVLSVDHGQYRVSTMVSTTSASATKATQVTLRLHALITFLLISIFTALHVKQTRYSEENSVCPSVSLSVCPSHAWIMTKRWKDLSRFIYHTKEHLS